VGQDRGGGHAEADGIAFGVVARRPGGGELLVHDGLQRAGRAETAEARRVVHPRQPGVEPGAQELQPVHGGRIVVGEEGSDPFAQVIGVGGCWTQGADLPGTGGAGAATRHTNWSVWSP